MVILPAYYAASLNADQNQVIQYYVDICEASPVRSDNLLLVIAFIDTHHPHVAQSSDTSATLQLPSKLSRSRHVVRCDRSGHPKSTESLRGQAHVS